MFAVRASPCFSLLVGKLCTAVKGGHTKPWLETRPLPLAALRVACLDAHIPSAFVPMPFLVRPLKMLLTYSSLLLEQRSPWG